MKFHTRPIGRYREVHCADLTVAQYCDMVVDPLFLHPKERLNKHGWLGGTAQDLVHDIQHGRPEWTREAETVFEEALATLLLQTHGETVLSTAPAGHAPCVPSFLSGRPDGMWCHEEDEGLGLMRIFISLTCDQNNDRETMLRRGLAIAAFAYAMQTLRPVELFGVVAVASNINYSSHNRVTIRLGTTPVDLSQLAVMLGHVGVGRRALRFGPKGKDETFGRWQSIPATELFDLGENDVFFPALQYCAGGLCATPEATRRYILEYAANQIGAHQEIGILRADGKYERPWEPSDGMMRL